MKKKALLLLPSLLLGLGIASCGDEIENDDNPSEKQEESDTVQYDAEGYPLASSLKQHPYITEDVTVKFDYTFGSKYKDCLNQFKDEFEALEPHVTIELNQISGSSYTATYNHEIENMAVGEYGNIISCYPDHVADFLEYRGKTVNFEKYLKSAYGYSKEEIEDFVPSYLDEGRVFYEKGMYLMPHAKSTEFLFYNAALIGVTIPGVNDDQPISQNYMNHLTWEELFDNFCPKFIAWNESVSADKKLVNFDTSEAANKYASVVGYDSDSNLVITLCKQLGLPYTGFDESTGYGSINFNTPEVRDVFAKLKEYKDKNYLITGNSANPGSTAYTSDVYKINNPQVLMTISSSAGATSIANSYHDTLVAPLPTSKDKGNQAISQGGGLCILSHGNEQQDLAAWSFIKYMLEPVNSLAFALCAGGYAPVRFSSYDLPDYAAETTISASSSNTAKLTSRVLGLMQDVTGRLFTSPSFKGSSKVREYLGTLIGEVLVGTDTTADSFKDKFDKAVEDLGKYII